MPGLGTSADARQVHALRLIAALLDGGYSARLPATLERGEELVSGASAWYDAFSRAATACSCLATPNVQKGKTWSRPRPACGASWRPCRRTAAERRRTGDACVPR